MDDRLTIDTATVRALIAGQYPQWAGLPVKPVTPGGWDNRTFRLGDALAVRLPTAARYVPQVEKEHRWLPVLAPALPLPIPRPVALGAPDAGFPFPWSVRQWIDGSVASPETVADWTALARTLATFLHRLHAIPTADGPAAGAQSFHRGGDLRVYDAETRAVLAALTSSVDAAACEALWRTALANPHRGQPVWVHGDLSPGNVLVRDGRLAAVIDFGSCAVGDPACDLVIAWTRFEPPARAAFRADLPLDAATWVRAAGWALWKALLVLSGRAQPQLLERPPATVIADLLAEPFSPPAAP